MFNEFTGDRDERQRKQEERLRLLKRAREDGFFDEEGTEEAEIIADGVGPDDSCPTCGELSSTFIGGDCAKCNPIQPLKNRPSTYECYRCRGLGDETRYGEIVRHCRACDGVGHLNDVLQTIDALCAHCDGFGRDVWGTVCNPCHGTGVRPDLEPTQ